MSYARQLKDPRWQKRRLQLMEAAHWTCRYCGAKDKPLHIHHLAYHRQTLPWDYADALLVVLCEDCHLERQEAEARLHGTLALATRHVPGRRLDAFTRRLIPEAFSNLDPA